MTLPLYRSRKGKNRLCLPEGATAMQSHRRGGVRTGSLSEGWRRVRKYALLLSGIGRRGGAYGSAGRERVASRMLEMVGHEYYLSPPQKKQISMASALPLGLYSLAYLRAGRGDGILPPIGGDEMRNPIYAWVDTLPPWRKVVLRELHRHSVGWRFLHEDPPQRWFFLPKWWKPRWLFSLRQNRVVYMWYLHRGKTVCVFVELLPWEVVR